MLRNRVQLSCDTKQHGGEHIVLYTFYTIREEMSTTVSVRRTEFQKNFCANEKKRFNNKSRSEA